jgi:hypothetical protein
VLKFKGMYLNCSRVLKGMYASCTWGYLYNGLGKDPNTQFISYLTKTLLFMARYVTIAEILYI